MSRPSATIPNPAFFQDPEVREAVADHFTTFAAIALSAFLVRPAEEG